MTDRTSVMLAPALCFSETYGEARRKFVQTAGANGADMLEFENPHALGPHNERLYANLAIFGNKNARKALVIISGTHGVEGFCGSACQLRLMQQQAFLDRAGEDVCIFLLHGLNPYGFAHLRRVNENNVDLNRNFIDHSAPIMDNSAYAQLHEFLIPSEWTDRALAKSNAVFSDYVSKFGADRFQEAISSGQRSHPNGLFYSSTKPEWSNTILRQIVESFLGAKQQVAYIDLHSGLGPSGNGEIILDGKSDAAHQRAQLWYDGQATILTANTSVSAQVEGSIHAAFQSVLAEDDITSTIIEFGTVPMAQVLEALRFEAWVSNNSDPSEKIWLEAKTAIKAAFYRQTHAWKSSVTARADWVVARCLNGLSNL